MQRLAGQFVPWSTIHRLVGQDGGLLAERRREEAKQLWESGVRGKEIPAPREGPRKEMGISLDGMMVWVEGCWHEVKVGSCFEFGPGKEWEGPKHRVLGRIWGCGGLSADDMGVCISSRIRAGRESGGHRGWGIVD